MEDLPDYDIAELLLAAVFICGALISVIWAGSGLYHSVMSIFLKGTGSALMFLGGMANPKKYILNLITLPFNLLRERTGRETSVTVLAGVLGLALSGAGMVAEQMNR